MNELDTLRAEKAALEKKYGQTVFALIHIMLLEGRGSARAARNIAHHVICKIMSREERRMLAAEFERSGWLAPIPFSESSDAAQE